MHTQRKHLKNKWKKINESSCHLLGIRSRPKLIEEEAVKPKWYDQDDTVNKTDTTTMKMTTMDMAVFRVQPSQLERYHSLTRQLAHWSIPNQMKNLQQRSVRING